jgi:2'-5' RNA ligase
LAALERPQWPGLRWTPAAQWHVTLRFFGEVDVDQGVDAGAGLARAARNAGPVVAEMGPVVGRIGRNVLQVPVVGLDDVAGAIISSTAEIGQAPGPRGFSGHITLARNRGKTPLSELEGAPVIGRWEVEEVSLVASLASGHPGVPNRYEVVTTFPLG